MRPDTSLSSHEVHKGRNLLKSLLGHASLAFQFVPLDVYRRRALLGCLNRQGLKADKILIVYAFVLMPQPLSEPLAIELSFFQTGAQLPPHFMKGCAAELKQDGGGVGRGDFVPGSTFLMWLEPPISSLENLHQK